ncbi:MAG TPA: hypothetical protein VND93_22075, partial [Myxococcales bacterium]|nr:hypothetical protein [Myxococcales bacterium]
DAMAQPFAASSADAKRLQARVRLAGTVDRKGLCAAAFAPYEPNPVWDRDFLDERARCYALAGDPRAGGARADLAAYDASASPPLDSLVKPAPPATR